jgi:hypothetical protein
MAITQGASRERDSLLISLCGDKMSLDPREWTLSEAMYLLGELGTTGKAAITPHQLGLVKSRGYDWREDSAVNTPYPETTLRLDAYARLDELAKFIKPKL